MKPHRLNITYNLVLNYGLHKQMTVYRPHVALEDELQAFHSPEYIEFLKRVTPDNAAHLEHQLKRFNVGDDCPVFDGVYRYCQLYSGGTIDGARKLCHQEFDIAINWSGGLHHAKKEQASGFCYLNDIVLGILELLKYHPRVLYIDIDVHHGDAVQDAFYLTDRVMTVSFHQYYDNFFPGTGALAEVGMKRGRHYSVNVPLKPGITDDRYVPLFKDILERVMQFYRPTAIVFQSGADSLQDDRLGGFCLTPRGHAECLRFAKSYGLPLLVLGGGGYTVRNVARCWTYETAVCLDRELSNDLPFNDYLHYFGPGYELHPEIVPNREDLNTSTFLDQIRKEVTESLRHIQHAPSVQMHHLPPEVMLSHFESTLDTSPDFRFDSPLGDDGDLD